MPDHSARHSPADAPELISAVLRNAAGLLRAESALIRAELSSSLSRARAGLVLLLAAALCVLVALYQLAAACAALLASLGLPEAAAALLTALIFAAIAAGLGAAARPRLDPGHLKPRRSLNSLQRDTETLKEARHAAE